MAARGRVFCARCRDRDALFCALGAATKVVRGWGWSDGRAATGCWPELAQSTSKEEKKREWSGRERRERRRKRKKMNEKEKEKEEKGKVRVYSVLKIPNSFSFSKFRNEFSFLLSLVRVF